MSLASLYLYISVLSWICQPLNRKNMPRRDLSNRDEDGNWKCRYEESLSRKTIGLRLFGIDQIAIEEIAGDIEVTPTELVREIVRQWVLSQIDERQDRDNLYLELKKAIHPPQDAGDDLNADLT